ncbi:MAG: nuclear transport factor 2 family protein [Pyrinomonadaceae bacterium]|nr:nuclear transport factor 2 family protein [Pyrinomonadaceae bacterium]
MKKNLTGMVLAVVWLSALTLTDPQLVDGQNTPKQDDAPKPPTALVDAWRKAVPEAEQPSSPAPASETAEVENSTDIEKKLIDLENEWMDSVKRRDQVNLERILASDFSIINERSRINSTSRNRYINSTIRFWRLSDYKLEKTSVRVYGESAVVNIWYSQQGQVNGQEASGEFLATDVWVKRDNRWQAVARHTSQQAKPPAANETTPQQIRSRKP